MSPETLFRIQLVLGYVAWLLCFGVYILPRLRLMDRFRAHRAIATLHSFRFFGLVFLLPGVVGSHLPSGFTTFSAYGDLTTGVLAMLALLTAGRVHFSGCSSAPLISWELPISSLTTTMQSGRPSCDGRGIGLHLHNPDHLCASVNDHARRCFLLVGASLPKTDQALATNASAA